ncbi:MAG: HAMP domain-containing protein [Blastocatellia bacterium]|nr:HAMP domain-containing protein [Blastocatellia bacterium]
MRTLFFKIFIWFWLAIALLIAASYTTDLSVQQDLPPQRLRNFYGNTVNVYAESTVVMADSKGLVGVQTFFDRLKRSSNIQAALYAGDEKLMVGNLSLPEVPELLKRAATGYQVEFEFNEGFLLAARRLVLADGKLCTLVVLIPRQRMSLVRDNPKIFYLRLLAQIITSGVICYALAKYLTGPVLKLREATHKFSHGELSIRVTPRMGRRRDELTDLARDFDEMASRIETLLQSQNRLLGDISHELRSPLSRLYVALGLARRKSGEAATEALDRIEHETERLNELISQVLMLARLESYPNLTEAKPVELQEIVEKIAADANFEARNQSRSVVITQAEACVVQGSGELLYQAVENVVRNAVKYTHPNTTVEIELSQQVVNHQPMAVVRVYDYGPGVPEAELEKLFQPFYRIGEGRDRKTGGVGLGLAIAQRATLLHQGTITASNCATGFKVEIRLPAITFSNEGRTENEGLHTKDFQRV